ncbi:hypothetical protein FDI21_gp255 [Pseudomonas phage Noxifer]|uniref:Uncharacterized protein n=1 Tax=Pseudomonas phage Noxifer TaxID=2006684 RepID=A0A1Y0T0I6_9CAUD|nr:hypothetical protein FDI21_gp255 [Pseudomonas phage Noxifer]ARV77456.1 hypothetical protein NOXIFER_291 [Pseudomonas phage Noxifer]
MTRIIYKFTNLRQTTGTVGEVTSVIVVAESQGDAIMMAEEACSDKDVDFGNPRCFEITELGAAAPGVVEGVHSADYCWELISFEFV